jgi:hypothetical protein
MYAMEALFTDFLFNGYGASFTRHGFEVFLGYGFGRISVDMDGACSSERRNGFKE